MSGLVLEAPAKINLTLEVDPPGPDGYHPIRSLMAVLPDLADVVRIEPAATRSVTCPGVPDRENLAWRALDALSRETGAATDLAVRIEKRIPSEAGLGGGSSDAAATLVGANRLLRLGLAEEDLERIAGRVGSDVAFFVRGGVQLATGRGDALAAASNPLPAAWCVLARPPFGLSTAAVYSRFDTLRPGARGPLAPRNELWPAALACAPALGRVARALRAAGAEQALLCGSGSTLAGICPDRPTAEGVRARLGAPDCWTAVSGIG